MYRGRGIPRRANVREFLECKLRNDAQELDQLDVCPFEGLLGFLLEFSLRTGDLRQVADEFVERCGIEPLPRRRAAQGRPMRQTMQKTGRPGCERVRPVAQVVAVVRQRNAHRHVTRFEFAQALLGEIVELRQRIAAQRHLAFVAAERLLHPDRDRIRAEHCREAREQTIGFRRAHVAIVLREQVLQSIPVCVSALRHTRSDRLKTPQMVPPVDKTATRLRAELTHPVARHYIACMADESYKLLEEEMKRLEARMDEIVRICDQLKEENRSLKQRQDSLISERASLLQKNELVRGRVEAMIGRLKAMENGS